MPHFSPTTDSPAQDQHVLERPVEFRDGAQKSPGRIDLYKRGCFVPDALQQAGQPQSAGQVAARLKRVRPDRVEPLVTTLAALSLVRQAPEGPCVA